MNNSNERIHGLDFSRAILMILGVFFHAGLIFGGGNDWRVTSEQHSPIINGISETLTMFRMEAFYLISGFFYILILNKGKPNFLKDRFCRAFIPMVFCGVTLNTFMNLYSTNYEFNWGLEYIIKGQWMGHLWFLGNLVVYFFLSQPLCNVVARTKPINRVILLSLFFVVTPFVSLACLVITKYTYTGNILFISFSKLLYYYCYFVLGIICFQNRNIFISILSFRSCLAALLIVMSVAVLKYISAYYSVNPDVTKAIGYFASAPLALISLSILVSMGGKGYQWSRKISDASYTIYLLHQPLLIWLYLLLFQDSKLSVWANYLLLVFLVFIFSYLFHILVVNNNKYVKLLMNGNLIKNNTNPSPGKFRLSRQ